MAFKFRGSYVQLVYSNCIIHSPWPPAWSTGSYALRNMSVLVMFCKHVQWVYWYLNYIPFWEGGRVFVRNIVFWHWCLWCSHWSSLNFDHLCHWLRCSTKVFQATLEPLFNVTLWVLFLLKSQLILLICFLHRVNLLVTEQKNKDSMDQLK